MLKKILCLFLTAALLLSGCANASGNDTEKTQTFTDSTGRTVTVAAEIERIAITGPLSQIYILPLAGDLLVGVSNAYAEDAQKYLPPYISEKRRLDSSMAVRGKWIWRHCLP